MKPTTAGWVYVLESARPGVVKIGRTARNAGARAREIEGDGAYADFAPFREAWSRPVSDCCAVEAAAHRMLSHRRVRAAGRSRELFAVPADEARRVVEAAADSLRGRYVLPHQRPASKRRWHAVMRAVPRPGQRCLPGMARRVLGAALVLLALWHLAGLLPP